MPRSRAQARPEVEVAASPLESTLAELDDLVGLQPVKEVVREVVAYARVQQKRAREQLVTSPLVLHMIFKGNPGTGKTTVARIIGRLFHQVQILSKGHLVEVERADLVGEYIGHTAQKTREQVKKALGGVLFVDEAYSLARGGEKDFGREAIDVLVRAMENYREQLVLILAGYKDEMEWFIRTNPGLRSRFPIQIDFDDYSLFELMAIGEKMLAERDYALSPEAGEELERILRRSIFITGAAQNGNARLVRNLIEEAMRRQAVRLMQNPRPTRHELMLLERSDFQSAIKITEENELRACPIRPTATPF
ncbi:MAG: AAA family ATPase [Clostridia bacterium]|nr:MAG: AAA family ATPase [Clostridia bacterium]